jgi:rhamnosyltransferase
MASIDAPAGPALLATVTVTYNPDIEILVRQLAQLPQAAVKVLVDNASEPELRRQLQNLANARPDVSLVQNTENAGLASALNQGARKAHEIWPDRQFLLLLDQDTETGSGGAEALLLAYQDLRSRRPNLGCVGPRLVDVATGLDHGFHQIRWGRWARSFPKAGAPVRVDNLNGSGTLVSVAAFETLGGLNDAFFIDHVDTDWAFRVAAAGLELYGTPEVSFQHRMGTASFRFWLLGWRIWPYRSPTRHFYLFRNTIRLLRAPYVPLVWKLWAPVKLIVTFLAHLGFDPDRRAQTREMRRGLFAGLDDYAAAGTAKIAPRQGTM